MNSGTDAIKLSLKAHGIKEGDEVITAANTFIATANAIMNAGGFPVFADCDEDMCLDYEDALEKITSLTTAICHVHIGGLVSDAALMLAKYCDDHGLFFVEDAAQAHGSTNKGKKAGTLGIAAGFSFYSTKVITTGEGGMVTTNDKDLVNKLLEKITKFICLHIDKQIEAGADTIQIFDSWAGLLPKNKLPDYCYIPTNKIVNYVKSLNDIFFNDLEIRKPDYFLGIKGSSFGDQ
mgnify:CR=1 FL=1